MLTTRTAIQEEVWSGDDLLGFIERTAFPAENVTTTVADWDDAPRAYTVSTTKLVLYRDPANPP